MRSRALAIAVAVVVPLAALGFVISRGGSSAHRPARLPIVAGASGGSGSTLGAARADAALYPYGGIVYKASAGLAKLDGSARAYKISAPDSKIVRELADAVGLSGVTADADGTFTSGDAQLNVTGSSWGYTRQSGDNTVSSGVAVACAPNADCPPPPTTIPQHPAGLRSQDEAKALAVKVAQSAGVDPANATIVVDDGITEWIVRIDPRVDGVPTEGFTTTVTVGENNAIDFASGTVGRPVAADLYPLIGTSKAIERLNNGQGFVGIRPLTGAEGALTPLTAAASASSGGAAAPAPVPEPPVTAQPSVTDTIPPPPPPQEITITGAEQVLLFAPSYDGSESWLVPGYRFTTSQGVGPTVLAIDDSFLTPPGQVSTDDVPTGKGSIDPGGAVPPSGPTGPPDTIEPPSSSK